MQNRITISKTKIAPINKLYKSDKYRKPENHIDWQRYKDLDFIGASKQGSGKRIYYTEALNNKVNKDYKVSYASDELTLIQSYKRIDFNKLKEFASLTGEKSSFNKILLGKNNELRPALRSTASKNPMSYRKDYIIMQANKHYSDVRVEVEPTDIIIIDIE